MVQDTCALLPLDGGRGLGGDVVDDAVDAFDFVDDAVGEAGKEGFGQAETLAFDGEVGPTGDEIDYLQDAFTR